jgi:excisionase family DNA binding protein
MKASERLLTVKEAEDRTGRKASTWRRDILERRVPYVKIGRSVRIPVEFIEKLITDGWREAILMNDTDEQTR